MVCLFLRQQGNERVRRLGDGCLSDSLHLYTLRRIRMYQQIMLVGNLSGDPKMRLAQGGTPVTSFRIVTNRSWRAQDGTTQNKIAKN